MTSVLFEREHGQYTVSVHGHVTGSAAGCAAVSTLLQALQGWMHDAEGVEVLEDALDYGDCVLRFRGDRCGTAFDVIYAGFSRLQETLPDMISCTLKKK